MNRWVAVIIIAVPISIMGVVYMLVRGDQFVQELLVDENDMDSLTDQQTKWLFLAAFALMPFVFGLLSSVVLGYLDSEFYFRAIAVGLTVLVSLVAILTRTPLMGVKVAANLMIGLGYGIFLPLLV